MSDKTTIVNLADEHQGHQNQYRLYFLRLLKSVNLQYNTLVRWDDGTNDSTSKCLTFQVFFFHNFL